MRFLRALGLRLTIGLVLVFASGHGSFATTINFETGAPCCFGDTTPLTTLYSSLGVTFSGVNGTGGSILDESGGFGILAKSGRDFLAFNGSGSEKVSFISPTSNFEVFVGDGSGGTYTATAFNSSNVQIGSTTISLAGGVYGDLSLALSGISYVVFGGPGVFVADDLSFTAVAAVPEPSTWAMMILGFCGLGFLAYRKKGTLRWA